LVFRKKTASTADDPPAGSSSVHASSATATAGAGWASIASRGIDTTPAAGANASGIYTMPKGVSISENDPKKYDFMDGQANIRNKYGALETAQWPRSNLVLFLTGLPTAASKYWENQAYQQELRRALKDATEGPGGIMDLEYLGAGEGYRRVLGNSNAGKLFQAIRANQSQKTVDSEVHLNQALAAMPIKINSVRGPDSQLTQNLAKLSSKDPLGADWAWRLLHRASGSWMDVRFRALRENAGYGEAGDRREVSWVTRGQLPIGVYILGFQINGMIHGADLQLDAFLLQMRYATTRYNYNDYQRYHEACFKHMYGMDSEVAIWLCKSLALIPPLPSSDIQFSGSRGPIG
jgi:hypothetical protein